LVEEFAPAPVTPTTLQTPRRARALNLTTIAALLALGMALLVFIAYFGVYLAYARNLISFPFDYDQGEGFELYDALRLARGDNIYLNNAQFPFYASNYPPVYRLMLVPLVTLFGPKLYLGRIVALVCSLVIGIVIFIASRRLWSLVVNERRDMSNSRAPVQILAIVIPAVAALAFFAANYVYHVGPLARAHVPMVMFAIAGIYCLDLSLRGDRVGERDGLASAAQPVAARHSSRRTVAAIVGVTLLLVAAFTKLQAVDALLAGFGFLLIRRPRWFAIFICACALVTAGTVIWLNQATGGQFWLNVVSANVNEYDINITWQTYAQWFQLQGVLIVCSIIYVVSDVVRALRDRSFRPLTIWSLYFVTGSALGMLTGKWGAGPTYLIAAIAAACVCTAGLFARLLGWMEQDRHATPGKVRVGVRAARLGKPVSTSGSVSSIGVSAPVIGLAASICFLGQAALNVHLPTNGRLFGPVAQVLGVTRQPSSYPPYPYFDSVGYTQLGHFILPEDIDHAWALAHRLETLDGPVLSEEAMLTLWAGKDVVTNPTQLLNLSKSGMLDTTQIISMVKQHQFGGVVFRAMFYPNDVKDAIVANYYWAAKYRINGFDYWLLLPNGK